jgi:hypothetical protein
MKNCPYCEDILYAEYSKKDMHVKYIGKLIPKYDLKYGQLLQCPDCENYWYEDYEPYHQYRPLLKQNLQLTLAWNSSLPISSPEHTAILKIIKATPPDKYGNRSYFIDFPVSCYYNDDWIEHCIIRFQKLPPYLVMFNYYKDFIRIDNIDKVRPSEFALPVEIRSRGKYTDEVRMGFNPILTSGPNHKYYSVTAMQNFFFFDDIKGSELKFESSFPASEGHPIISGFFPLPIKYVLADWEEDMLKCRV